MSKLKNKPKNIEIPKRKVSDFKWYKNGDRHTNCPGGYVIERTTGYDVNLEKFHYMPPYISDAEMWVVRECGRIVQICTSLRNAKSHVVAILKNHAKEYLNPSE